MTLASRLAHVTWLGGSPCAGKSTIADRIAAEHDMTVYRCDDAFFAHAERLTPESRPVFSRLAQASPDEVWLRPVRQQIDEEIELYREEFPMIIEDLLSLPSDRPLIAEGAALMPELLHSLGIADYRMLWMVPTEAFQRHHYGQRAWRHEVLRKCSDPERGWENWMRRDAGFAREIARQASECDLKLITVDGSRSINDTYADVTGWLNIPTPSD